MKLAISFNLSSAPNFPETDAYRFNSASIRVRVIDDRFEGKSIAEREAMVLPLFKKLPKKTRDDVLLLLTLAPSEQRTFNSQTLMTLSSSSRCPPGSERNGDNRCRDNRCRGFRIS